MRKPTSHVQMSEAFLTSILLTFSGGFQDAYTYFLRGKVFANAQTGNIVLMSGSLFAGKWMNSLLYLIPLISFVLGIYTAHSISRKLRNIHILHWRQFVILGEILVLLLVGFMPQSLNFIANSLVSFVCAMQLQTFRKMNGNSYVSTMCMGNMRSGVDAFSTFTHTKEKAYLKKSIQYFLIILTFGIGAGLGSLFSKQLLESAIWISCAILLVVFFLLFIKQEEREEQAEDAALRP